MLKITFKNGPYDITIEGETVSEIKEKYDNLKDDLEKQFGKTERNTHSEQSHKTTIQEKTIKEGTSEKIMSLQEEGFFDTPKLMGDIKKKLEEKGFFYPMTSLPPYLLQLCKSRKLRRFKEKRNDKEFWVYVKS